MLVKSSIALLFVLLVHTANSAEKITVAFGEILAPWIIVDSNQGIIVDIIEAAMTPLGYEIDHLYLPYARRTKAYQVGHVDVVSDMNLNTITKYDLQGYFSDIAYSYETLPLAYIKIIIN